MSKRLLLIFHGRYPSEKAAAIFAEASARSFEAEGYAVTILAPRRRGRGKDSRAVYLPTLDLFGLVPHALAFRISYFVFSLSASLYLFFTRPRTDLVYSNEALPLWVLSQFFPHTVYELHDYPEQYAWFYRGLLRRVRGVVVTNQIKAERVTREFALDRAKLLVEQNAVDMKMFGGSVSREVARQSVGFSSDQKHVVYTGHLYGWKGVDTLAQAFRFLPPNTRVYLIGGTAEDVARMQKEYLHTQNIIFKGNRPHEEIPLWQKAADVLVLPNTAKERISAEDTSPMKLFEYMASGTPIVASRLPSITEIVDNTTAWLVEPDNPEALAAGIKEALASSEREVRAARARTWVEDHTWEKRAKRLFLWLSVLPDPSEQYRHERFIFWSSLAASVLFLCIFIANHGINTPFSLLNSDAYLPLAVELYEQGVFNHATTHTPGYPLFLAFTAVPWGSVLPALVLQALLLAFTAVYVYRLFEGVFSPRVRFAAALIFGIEPFTVFVATQPLSEALFLFLFIFGLYSVRYAYTVRSKGIFFLGGIVLGASALVRPVAFYLLPILVLVVGLLLARRNTRHVVMTALFAAGMLLIVLPWSYRNHVVFDTWSFSNKGPFSLYFYEVGEFIQYREGVSREEANQILLKRAQREYPDVQKQDDLGAPTYSAFLTRESFAILSESPMLFAKLRVLALGTFFLSDGYRLLWYELSRGEIALPNITRAIATGDQAAIVAYFVSEPVQAVLFVLGLVFWVGALVLGSIGSLHGLVSRDARLVVLASVALIAYFALMSGLGAQARYRIPVTPFLFMLASYGASLVIERFSIYGRNT